MKIIISPAKKMMQDENSMAVSGYPAFAKQAEELHRILKKLSYEELKGILKCNDKIAELNFRRFRNMKGLDGQDGYANLTPALLTYEGIQYQYMAPRVFSDKQWEYVQENLRILSGFYGILKPLDGVCPYRLEMQAALGAGEAKNLYQYWGESIYRELIQDDKLILNLASKEYSKAVEPYLEPDVRFVTCIFGEAQERGQNRRIRVKATQAKMARGEMVRWLAEKQIGDIKDIREFNRLDFTYSPEDSGDDTLVFLKPVNKESQERV
ncbi:peroxide stress protein YaaA [uncultured Robinsoniella sp.]|uniref:peroxide stress protein YaaA n=1 Tax=uncultured Robinsoniella sp. TaxID=904190 RepID=UPI00374EA3CC